MKRSSNGKNNYYITAACELINSYNTKYMQQYIKINHDHVINYTVHCTIIQPTLDIGVH